jgi:ATP-dependent DNA helicase PIF1
MEFNELINLEPILVAFYFNQRFNSFFTKILLAHDGPLGKVTGYFYWRREYQARGALHFHFKLWIENAPTIGVDTDEKVCDFIDTFITCRMPDPVKEPVLYELVNKYQIHKCTGSCQRVLFRHKSSTTFCRYGFPRLPQVKTTLNTVDEETVRSRKRGQRKKIYNLRRTKQEERINDYNPLLLLLWKANMDIQFIGE